MPQSDKYEQNNCLLHPTPLSLLHRKQIGLLNKLNEIMGIIYKMYKLVDCCANVQPTP